MSVVFRGLPLMHIISASKESVHALQCVASSLTYTSLCYTPNRHRLNIVMSPSEYG